MCDAPDAEIVVIGERNSAGKSPEKLTELARQEFSKQAGNCNVVDRQKTLQLIGFVLSDLDPAREALDNAERYHAIGNPQEARRNAVDAVDYIIHAAGTDAAWQLVQRARVLLACVSLNENSVDAERRASHDLLPLALVRPDVLPDPPYCNKMIPQIFQRAVTEAASRERGILIVKNGNLLVSSVKVWIDGVLANNPDNAVWNGNILVRLPTNEIELPEGTYTVVVTYYGSAFQRSLSRRIAIKQGTETRLRTDLDLENTVDPAGGPSIGPDPLPPPSTPGTSLIAEIDSTNRSRHWVSIEYLPEGNGTWVSMSVYSGAPSVLKLRAKTEIRNGDEASAVKLLTSTLVSGSVLSDTIIDYRDDS